MYLFVDAVSRPDFIASNGGMTVINESERIWKEAVMIFVVNEAGSSPSSCDFPCYSSCHHSSVLTCHDPPHEVCNGSDKQHLIASSGV
jgi:hypothetical protein